MTKQEKEELEQELEKLELFVKKAKEGIGYMTTDKFPDRSCS